MAAARNKRKRRRSRGRLGPLFKLLCILAVVVAMTVGATVFFQVETVAVSGNSRYTEEEIIRVSGIQTGDNLYRMNKVQIKDRLLEELPYIEALTIRRSLPSTIVIHVWEWEAVARIQAPAPDAAPGESEGDASAAGEEPLTAAREDWLISAGGKLLEPAPEDSTAMLVTGVTLLVPRAGTQMVLPQEEQPKLEALKALLSALEERELQRQVSAVELGSTQVVLHYLDRFKVKLPLNADFGYKLDALSIMVQEVEKRLGDQTKGVFDLTQEGMAATYSPE